MQLDGRNCFWVVLLKYCLIIVVSGVDPRRDHYTAAVVEYYRTIEYDELYKVNAEATLNKNAEHYLNILKMVEQQITESYLPPLDIIVYPESTLYAGFNSNVDYLSFGTAVPTAADKKVPCDDNTTTYRKFLADLSCASRQSSTYMVVNVIEQEVCTDEQQSGKTCALHGFNLFNTNVAFDRNGTVIAKYRKFNLFNEPLNKTDYAENVFFQTDFGVEFGTFTCFDIVFKNPALELVDKGIKHFIFPTMWFSELPFLVSVQAQEMWARENDVVLLAAGALNPDIGSGGSGIYQGSYGALDNILTAGKDNQYIVLKEVPKKWTPKSGTADLSNAQQSTKVTEEDIVSLDKFVLIWDNNTDYTSELLNVHVGRQHSATICSTTVFCCDFIIVTKVQQTPLLLTSQKDVYHYRMFAYSGVRSFTGAYNGGLEVCALVACTDSEDQTSCGKRFPDASNIIWPTTFSTIIIQANFTKSTKRAQFPNSLRWNLKAVPAAQTDWETTQSHQLLHRRTHKTLAPQTELLTFGIYGRDFARDSEPNSRGAQNFVTLVIVVVVMFLSMVLNFYSIHY